MSHCSPMQGGISSLRRTVTSSRPASLPNRLAPHLLVLWALCLFAASLAHSQVSEALVSNIAETTRASSTGQFSNHHAQRFETGNNPAGYTVTGVDLDLNVDADADTLIPMLSIAVDKTNIAEDAGVATVTVSTLLPFSTDQTIDLTLAGTADENIDYIVSATSLTLTTGQTSVSATVTASNDNYDDDAETVIVTATSGDDDIGAVTVTIDDDDAAATLSVSVNNPSISEAGGISTLTVSTGGTIFATDQTIDLMLAGTATMTDDYIISDTSLTLPANATSISATVTAVQNTIEEPSETVLITASHNGAPIGTQQTVTITDDEARPPMLSEAKVNGNRMTLVFDEDLNPDATPAPGAFAVRVNGRSVTVQALSRTNRPTHIVLLLASAAVQYDPASVSYTVPNHVPNRLQDSSGYHVAAITAHRVENTTPAPADADADATRPPRDRRTCHLRRGSGRPDAHGLLRDHCRCGRDSERRFRL